MNAVLALALIVLGGIHVVFVLDCEQRERRRIERRLRVLATAARDHRRGKHGE